MASGSEVTILLSTYNGAAYLPAQLQSLRDQQQAEWRLLWRDDGSADESAALVTAFARAMPGRAARLEIPAGGLGVAASYHALARVAEGCIAFCDQDDVWLPDKLARGVAALRTISAQIPALYCARQTLVDAALRPLGLSLTVPLAPSFPMALAQNIATGCTVMLNPAAAALLCAAPPPAETLHDWWSLLLVTGAGGRVIVDPVPAVLYRQHPGNAVGAPRGQMRRGMAALRRGRGAFMTVFRGNIAALESHKTLLNPQAGRVVSEIGEALAGGPGRRLRVLGRVGLRRQNWLETVLFAVWFVAG